MTKNKNIVLFILFLSILVLPFIAYSPDEPLEGKFIDEASIDYYQINTCKIGIFDVLKENINNKDLIYKFNNYPGIDCYGSVTGLDKLGDKFYIYIGSNNLVNFIHQSSLWILILYAFIDKNKNEKEFSKFSLLIVPLIFSSQLLSEESFYETISKSYSRDMSLDNFFFLSFILSYLILTIMINEILIKGTKNLIYFLPFAFILNGTYLGMNINFFLVIFSILGVKRLLESKFFTIPNFIFILFSFSWIFRRNDMELYFDVDKLRGFINSSNSNNSLVFWILVFYLFINGAIYLYKENIETIDLEKLSKNFLISGSIIVLLGFISSLNSILNLITFYTLGLNKYAMRTMESVEGSAWRGISPSAELVGEFFAFVLLFFGLLLIKYKYSISKIYILFIVVNLYGLYRSNNRSATMLLLIILLIFYIKEKKYFTRNGYLLIAVICIITLALYVQFISDYSYKDSAQLLLVESLRNSNITIDYDYSSGYVEKFFLTEDYGTLVNSYDNSSNISTSQRTVIDYFISGNNIKFLPNPISVISIISVVINRSEKWGIFLAKYNPDTPSFLLGYGPQNLSFYEGGHAVSPKVLGLVLPHSSFLVSIIFFGLIGTLIILYLTFRRNNSNVIKNDYSNYLLVFIVVNFIKSDSLLYHNGILLFLFIVFLYKRNEHSYSEFNLE